MESYEKAFSNTNSVIYDESKISSSRDNEDETEESSEDILEMIKKSGFEYVDKRPKGGSLWIVAGESEGAPLVEKCKKLGVSFAFAPNGGRASKHRPAWYSLN